MNFLEKRIIELSFRHKLTHISSCLNTVNTLAAIYAERHPMDPVVLGNSHAALALYVVLESHDFCNAEEMIAKHGTHAGRDMEHGIWVSGGSLGQAETVAVGMAIAERNTTPARTVWLVTSDGALAEGSTYEAFRLASDLGLFNLNVHVIANGFGGYGAIDPYALKVRLHSLRLPNHFTFVQPTIDFPFLQGLAGHYTTINEAQYQEMMAA